MIPLGTLRRYVLGLLAPVASSVETMVGRAVIKAVDETKRSMVVELDGSDDDLEDVEVPQTHGVSFKPPAGAEVVLLAIGGASANRIGIVAQDRTQRPTDELADGEGGLYVGGEYRVFLAEDGSTAVGSKEPSEWAAIASKVDAEIDRLWDAVTGFTPVAQDGGAALKTYATSQQAGKQSVASSKVKVEP